MLGARAAAAADHIHHAAICELADDLGHLLRRFVVFAEFVWQTCVWMRGNTNVGDSRELIDIRAQFAGAQRTVKTDHERIRMPYGIPEGLAGLSGERTAGRISDRARDHDRHFKANSLEAAFNREDGGFGVQCVKNRFDHQKVDAALKQGNYGLFVCRRQFGKTDISITRVVNVRRKRRRAIGWPENACDPARFTGLRRVRIGTLAREVCGHQV